MNKWNEALDILINNNGDKDKTFDQQLEQNIDTVLSLLSINKDTVLILISSFEKYQNENIRWKYIQLLFYCLLSAQGDQETLVSINHITNLKKSFQNIISLGILPYIVPGIGIDIKKRSKYIQTIATEQLPPIEQYYQLAGTTTGLILCLNKNNLKNYIISHHFNDLLSALLQLSYAPLKKPENQQVQNLYSQALHERPIFQRHFVEISNSVPPYKLIQELMFFYGSLKSPKWLKTSVFSILNQKLQENHGVESLINAMITEDISALDIGANWKQFEIIVKLIVTKPGNIQEDIYFNNMTSQILNLLLKTDKNGMKITSYEYIVALSTKYLFELNRNAGLKYLLNPLLLDFFKITELCSLANFEHKINLLFLIFCESSGTTQIIPISELNPIVNILFNIFLTVYPQNYPLTTEKLSKILIKFINDSGNKTEIFDLFLFNKNIPGGIEFNNFEFRIENKNLKLIKTNKINILKNSNGFFDLIKNSQTNFITSIFLYLLEISTNFNLSTELDDNTERKLISYNLLSNLVSNEKIQNHLKQNPAIILQFIETALSNYIASNSHKSQENDSTGQFQILFLLIMLVSILLPNVDRNFENLIAILNKIRDETTNNELKLLISSINNSESSGNSSRNKSEYEQAIEEILDPLLPIRGHGLMVLAKLLEDRNPEAFSNKQYILNLCQEQLKNEDSYIYLNAIRLLAALGASFPEIIINLLTEEYASSSSCKDYDTRMKVGEVLLRVVKSLGELTTKYKSLLLNCFLLGVKDDDHLMRASSLSILGELCRVLGYQLGPVVSEVLTCIHVVIDTDPAVEARRAAVSVIRSLFIGLQKDMIVVLKNDILPIYRSLKKVYTSDPDDITRLQAQLALEELNENMKEFIFPNRTVNQNNINMLK